MAPARSSLRRLLLGVAAAAAMSAASATPAAASAPHPWQPFRSEPFTTAAGDQCPFAMHGAIVKDHELVRTLQTNPDGSPREQEFVGALIIRFTNLATGASVTRNLTGTAFFFTDPDGNVTGDGRGHIALGVHSFNTDPPAGEYVLTGRFDFTLNADHTRDFHVQGGNVENICETLA
jgi:hypothetical protein